MKILLVGDSCQDMFVYGSCKRLCPEGPVPVFNPVRFTVNVGMAGNVYENIKALNYECEFLTNSNLITKTRYIDERANQLLLRIDENDHADLLREEDHLSDKQYASYDMIIISDYCKGFLTNKDIARIANANDNVFLDTKKLLDNSFCSNVKFIKINEVEYEATKNTIQYLDNANEKLIVTKGKYGCEYNGKNYEAPEQRDTIDISGAGDTFMAAFSVRYTETKNVEKAIKFAQECTQTIINKKGVATVNS